MSRRGDFSLRVRWKKEVGMGNCVVRVGMGNCVVRITTFKVVDSVIWNSIVASKRSVRDRMVRSAVGRVS